MLLGFMDLWILVFGQGLLFAFLHFTRPSTTYSTEASRILVYKVADQF